VNGQLLSGVGWHMKFDILAICVKPRVGCDERIFMGRVIFFQWVGGVAIKRSGDSKLSISSSRPKTYYYSH